MVRRIPLSGGDVSSAFRVEFDDGSVVFEKTKADARPGFFAMEAVGLEWLRSTHTVRIPEVLAVGEQPNPLLRLSWIDEGGRPSVESDGELGRALAALHRSIWPCFGRPDEAPTGSLGVPNRPVDSWVELYGEQRLRALARIGSDHDALAESTLTMLESLAGRLSSVGGEPEPPSLLHGDLWAGNRIIDRAGQAWLIDPAAHGGHREFDLSMMRLFGGFSDAVFAAYDDAFPLADGWRQRIALHQIAPLVVHAIKFGGGYHAAADQALRAYL